MRRDGPFPSLGKILLDQGSGDGFLTGKFLRITAQPSLGTTIACFIQHDHTKCNKSPRRCLARSTETSSGSRVPPLSSVPALALSPLLPPMSVTCHRVSSPVRRRRAAEPRSPGESLRGEGTTHRDADAGTHVRHGASRGLAMYRHSASVLFLPSRGDVRVWKRSRLLIGLSSARYS